MSLSSRKRSRPRPRPFWNVEKGIAWLESVSGDGGSPSRLPNWLPLEIARDVHTILRQWRDTFCGDSRPCVRQFLNRKMFLHELQEALVPLSMLVRFAQETKESAATLIDLASGKGLLGVIVSALVGTRSEEDASSRGTGASAAAAATATGRILAKAVHEVVCGEQLCLLFSVHTHTSHVLSSRPH